MFRSLVSFKDMELLAFSRSSPCCLRSSKYELNQQIEKRLNSRRNRIVISGKRFRWKPMGFFVRESSNHLKKGVDFVRSDESRLIELLEGASNSFNSNFLRENCNDFAIEREDYVKKIVIPGLPDESEDNQGSPISSCYWEWKPGFTVHYEKAGRENVNSPPLLFLPGFGVGSFHYEKQLRDLGIEFRVWAVDFLGQGMSLPTEDPAPFVREGVSDEEDDLVWGFGKETQPWADDLVYSMDLWRDQIRHFVEEVIGEPVYIVGNSLGGFVALYFAACHPQLVKGVTLLNATPFWGFLPNPVRSPFIAKIFPWAGTFPLPAGVIKLIEIVWQKISDPRSIQKILKQVYADHSVKIDKVFSRILETTQHPAAAASFASIIFAPMAQLSFEESLSRCKTDKIPICLMYGREDPWVKPLWGLRVKQQLPEAPYYEISPAGHCPHDEVPEVVNYLLRGWIGNLESQGSLALPLLDGPESVQYGIPRELEFVKEGSRKSVMVRFVGSIPSLWNQISSFIKPRN